MIGAGYPVQFSVDYPDRSLDRLTTAFRIVIVIPIAIVLGTLAGTMWQSGGHEIIDLESTPQQLGDWP